MLHMRVNGAVMSDLVVWQQVNGRRAWSKGMESASLLMAPPMMANGPKAPGAAPFSFTAGHTSLALLNSLAQA